MLNYMTILKVRWEMFLRRKKKKKLIKFVKSVGNWSFQNMLCYILCFLPYLQFGSATRTVCTWIVEKWQQGSKRKLCKLLAHLWALLWIVGPKVITIHALFAVIRMKTKFTVQNVWWLDFQTWSWIGLFIFLNSIFRKVEFVWKYLHICGFISLDLHQYTSGYG